MFLTAWAMIDLLASELPWRFYLHLILEKKYKVYTFTCGKLCCHLMIVTVINIVAYPACAAIILGILASTANYTYYVLWIASAVVVFMLIFIYPILIDPIFNKHAEMKDETPEEQELLR